MVKRSPGRRRGKSSNAKTKPIPIRFSPIQKDLIKEAAAAYGTNPSDFIRTVVLERARSILGVADHGLAKTVSIQSIAKGA